MIKITECIVKWVKPLQHWGLSLNLHIKKEDISKEDREKLEELWSNWDSLVWVLQNFTWEKEIDIKPKLRQTLAMKIKTYSEKSGYNEDSLVDKFIYQKYNVKSRTELTEQQLKECIDYFDLSIQESQLF